MRKPTTADAERLLRLYELRRETELRRASSRAAAPAKLRPVSRGAAKRCPAPGAGCSGMLGPRRDAR